MVEISKSGSGEGSGWETGRAYSTAEAEAEKRPSNAGLKGKEEMST